MPSSDVEEECEYTETPETPEVEEEVEEEEEEEVEVEVSVEEAEEMAQIWRLKEGGEVKVEKDEERSVFIAKFSAVRADTIERPEWDIAPAPLPANLASGPREDDRGIPDLMIDHAGCAEW